MAKNSNKTNHTFRGINILLICLLLLFASLQYKVICLLILVLYNRSFIKSSRIACSNRWFYSSLIIVLLLAFFLSLPNFFQRGRTQLIYLDKDGETSHIPLEIYATNVAFPEVEIMNAGILGAAFMPFNEVSISGHRIGGGLLSDAKHDFWRGKLISFYTPFYALQFQGSNPGSAAIGQLFNERLNRSYDPIYVTRPRHWDKSKAYPLVIFCHGYLGNWEMYQGILSGLNGCVILSIGTKDLSGIFNTKDIGSIFARYIPFLEKQGLIIDKNAIHLVGLSNGGSAANCAFANYSNRFKSITFLSTGCHTIKHSRTKILLIGGVNDSSSSNLPAAKRALDKCGTNCSLLYLKDTDHFLMATNKKEMHAFLIEEMELQP